MSGPDYSRSRERADAIRAQLEPLGPDERPLGLKLAVALALFIAVANIVGAVAGAGGESPVVAIVFAVLMLVLARAMWDRRYLAVVAFEGAARAHDHRVHAVAGVRRQPARGGRLRRRDRRLRADLLAARSRDGAPAGAA